MASTNPDLGMSDFLPSDVRKREYVLGIIREVYESYGFEPLESVETFQKKIEGDDKSVEANAILAVNEALSRLGIKNFAIYLSHGGILEGILETVVLPRLCGTKPFPPSEVLTNTMSKALSVNY